MNKVQKLSLYAAIISIIITILTAIYNNNHNIINSFFGIKKITTNGFIASVILMFFFTIILILTVVRRQLFKKLEKDFKESKALQLRLNQAKIETLKEELDPIHNSSNITNVVEHDTIKFWCQIRVNKLGPDISSFSFLKLCTKCLKPMDKVKTICPYCKSKQKSLNLDSENSNKELEQILFFKFIEVEFPDFYPNFLRMRG